MGAPVYKIAKTENGIEMLSVQDNVIYNFSETTWEIIKALRKYDRNQTVKEIAKLFEISEEEAIEDIQTVLTNLKIQDIDIKDIPIDVSGNIFEPRMVQIDVTPRCNSKCIYCLSSDRMSDETELSAEEIKKTITDLKDLGLWILTISGGEPLLRKDIYEILDHIVSLNIPMRFFTNGLLIDDETAKKLSKYKDLMLIQVSLDSCIPEHHDKQRGVKGSFEKTLQGIKNLLKYGMKPVIASIITPITFDDVEKTVEFLHGIGVDFVRCGPAKISSEQSKTHEDVIYLDLSQVKVLGDRIKNLSKKYEGLMRFSISAQMLDYSLNPDQTTDMPVCTAGISSLYISSSGIVYPCIALGYKDLEAGDLKKATIKEIWENSKMLKKLRKLTVEDFEKCKTCKAKDVCKGGCRGNAFDFFKDLKAYDPSYCEFFEN